MNVHRLCCVFTGLACAATCVAYEAVRINGWFNRFGSMQSSKTFYDVAFGQWHYMVVLLYGLIFAPLLVVCFSRCKPKLRAAWTLFAIAMLGITCANVSNAHVGRWSGTSDSFALFYIFVVPIPALVFFVIGLNAQTKSQS